MSATTRATARAWTRPLPSPGPKGARITADPLWAIVRGAPATMQSSMQKDVAAGSAPELDAIAGPILRGGTRYGIPVPVTAELARLVESRAHGTAG